MNRLLTETEMQAATHCELAPLNCQTCGSGCPVLCEAQDKKTIKYVIDKIEKMVEVKYELIEEGRVADKIYSYTDRWWQSLKEELLNE